MFLRKYAPLLIALIEITQVSILRPTDTNGPKVTVLPEQATAGSHLHIQFKFTIGSNGIKAGGGVRIELPVAYLETEPYYWDKPQIDVPDGRGYVQARSSSGSEIGVEIYGSRDGIIECVVLEQPLKSGDELILKYAGVVQSLTWKLRIPAQWRKTQDAPWRSIAARSSIVILPQPAVTLLVVTPADVARGQDFDMKVVLLDKFGNLATEYEGTVTFSSTDPDARYPKSYSFTKQDFGRHIFPAVRFEILGFQRIDASDENLTGRTNYSEVSNSPRKYKRYFGETHFHTGTGTNNQTFSETGAGGDHRGHFTTQAQAYRYIRDVSCLDFASASEHDSKNFDDRAWETSQAISDSFYKPGKFTTFFTYEWTAAAQEGHHVVIYEGRGAKVLNHFDYPTKLDLWKALARQGRPAIMVPHPMWTQPDHRIWDQVNNQYRKIGEIYSLWNNRFLLQPGDDPQRFEEGLDSPWSFQYAWDRGHQIGVVGSSDNHTGHPGANNYTHYTQHTGGLAVVLAEENTRDAIWRGLDKRRTYATTGTRILLSFTSDGYPMGAEYETNGPPRFSIKVAGTNRIESVELIKHDSHGYRVVFQDRPEGDIGEYAFTDESFSEDSMYYLRVKQVDERWRGPWAYGTAEMAWSSPIWIYLVK